MVQGDHWLDTCLAQRVELAAVGVQRRLVELPAPRLDAGPFDRHAIGIQTQLSQQPNVVWPAVPGVTCSLRCVGKQARLFGAPPVAVHVVAFDLVGGSRGAPQEAVGEAHHSSDFNTVAIELR